MKEEITYYNFSCHEYFLSESWTLKIDMEQPYGNIKYEIDFVIIDKKTTGARCYGTKSTVGR